MSDVQIEFEAVMARFGALIDAASDREIYEALRLKQAAYAQRKSRKTIPYEALIHACVERNLKLDDVFGLGEASYEVRLSCDHKSSQKSIEHQLLCGMLLEASDTDLNKVGMRIQRIAGALKQGALSEQRIEDAVALAVAFESVS